MTSRTDAVPPLAIVALVSPAHIAHTAFAFPTVQNFWVPIKDSVGQSYDRWINRYKVREQFEHRYPQAVLAELESIEKEITQGIKQLREMLT